jgi:REP element-mobilizing transposase RayT
MKKNTGLLEPNRFYHVLNRGINGEQIFKQVRNYNYFLERYAEHIEPIADTYAYVLMGNHFHFLIRTKPEVEVRRSIQHPERKIQKIYGNQFAKLFNGYTQAINNQEGRSGGLFERPFIRIPVETDPYLLYMSYYIHRNPKKHNFVKDFTLYPHSSYQAIVSNEPTPVKLAIPELLSWYGGLDGFLTYHASDTDLGDSWYEQYWAE